MCAACIGRVHNYVGKCALKCGVFKIFLKSQISYIISCPCMYKISMSICVRL